jgi:transcriptional regulator NrdR family protein
MICINCFHIKTSVANSRPHKKQPSVWRRRTCAHCRTTFTTHERVALSDQRQVSDGKSQMSPFNIGRLIISVSRAFSHDPSRGKGDALWLAQTIETSLVTQTSGNLTTDQLAHMTYGVLKKYDELAAVQYAAQHQLISSLRKRGRPSLVSPEQQTQQ